MRRVLGWVGLAIALLLGAAEARSGEPETSVRAALARWTEAFNAGEKDRVCDLFAPDLIATVRDAPERDFAAICSQLRRALDQPDRRYRYAAEIKEVLVAGDLAVVRLYWTLEIRDRAGALVSTGVDAGLDVFRRQPGGQWRIARFIAFDMPQP